MDSEKLLEWLVNEKKMGVRSAKDVLSRCGRVYRMLGVDFIDGNTLESLLKNEDFMACSMFIKSQLKRAVSLYLEFKALTKNE